MARQYEDSTLHGEKETRERNTRQYSTWREIRSTLHGETIDRQGERERGEVGWLVGWLVVLGFNVTLTAKVISRW